MNDPRKSVYIAVLNQGTVRFELFQILFGFTKSRFKVYIEFPTDKPIAHNRALIVKRFLKSGFDYLMMLDSDIIPPPNVLDLVLHDKDIISPLLFAYKGQAIFPLAMKYQKKNKMFSIVDIKDARGLHEVEGTGTGCIIIKRKVLEDIKAPFLNVYDKDGVRIMGLDFAFCRKARKKGYKIWVDLNYWASHWTVQDLKQIYRTLAGEKLKVVPLAPDNQPASTF